MLPILNHFPTNWVDGMKITRKHFIDSENAILDVVRDSTAASLTAFNYGLLEPLSGEKSSLDYEVVPTQNGNFKITVRHCRAVTSGGGRIEILPGLHPEIISDHKTSVSSEEQGGANKSATAYFAVISVNPFIRQPFGPASAEEYPPRNQHAISTFQLSLIPEADIDTPSIGAWNLPVARFVLQGAELVRDTQYVPPCAVIAAHPGTRQLYNEVSDQLGLIQQHSTGILRKILDTDGHDKALAPNVQRICEQSIRHIGYEFFAFRTIYRQQSPVHVANCVVRLANVINVSTISMSSKDKQNLFEYFSYWNGMKPGKIEEAIADVINAEYNHENLREFFQPLLDFMKMWGDLLAKLLELKHIGDRKTGFDLGGVTREDAPAKGKGKFSLLD